MTPEEYIMDRLLKLELENQELKKENERLKAANDVAFRFVDTGVSKYIYKVELENGSVKVSKKSKNE